MPNLCYELHHKICNLRYGTHGYLWGLPLAVWIDGFSQLGCCMLHSLGLIKNRTVCFQDFGSGRSLESSHCDFKRQCQLDFEITMAAFLGLLPATTSGSAPENKQSYFLCYKDVMHATHNL